MGVSNHDLCLAESQRQAQEQELCEVGKVGEAFAGIGSCNVDQVAVGIHSDTNTVLSGQP